MISMTKEQMMYKRIGKNVRKYRLLYSANKTDLTQKDLANRIGVSVSLIGGLESPNSTQGISVYNLYRISEVLEVPIDQLIE